MNFQNEEVLRAIYNLKSGSQSMMFDTFVLWLQDLYNKELNVAIAGKDEMDRHWSQGKVQHLKFILRVIETAEENLKKIKNRI